MQSHKMSLIEQVCNVGSGFIVALVVWSWFIVPVFDMQVSMTDNLTITSIFTIVSIIRGYLWRRLFNKWSKK